MRNTRHLPVGKCLQLQIATSLSMMRHLQLCESGKTRKLKKNAGDAQWGVLMWAHSKKRSASETIREVFSCIRDIS
eukprot:COSAG01_NODE_2883_length_6913_cov_14.005429_8_plen_76_part_00